MGPAAGLRGCSLISHSLSGLLPPPVATVAKILSVNENTQLPYLNEAVLPLLHHLRISDV